MSVLLGHGIGGVTDLPVPTWLFYYGGAIVLVLSFVALGVLWRRPRLERASRGRPLPPALQRIALSSLVRVAAGGLGLALLLLVALAALLGDASPTRNIAPTFVWVLFWLGLVPVVVLVGNVWPAVNPWRAAADAVAWLRRRAGRRWETLPYPARLGRWPAAVLLFAFVALELAYTNPAGPRALALAVYLYSAVTWLGMVVFGRRAWLENGEAFSVYFSLLGRVAPFALVRRKGRREVIVRAPLSGLAVPGARPGTLAFVAVMLGSVAFDGGSRTAWWQDRRYELTAPLVADSPSLADLVAVLLNLGGLTAAIVAVALAYLGAVTVARAAGGVRQPLAGSFLASLVPIALAYAVAHYFSLLVLQGPVAVPLASDPFGRGWDLFGTAALRPDLVSLPANLVWYVQVGALVVGHVLGLVVAHDRAIALFRSARTAVRTQYALLALMVLYTVGGLWLLSVG